MHQSILSLLAIYLGGTKQPVRTPERQPPPAIACRHRAVEAGAAAGVARGTGLLDPDPDRVLIAIHPHLDHALGVTGALALAPQRIARGADAPGLPSSVG